MNIIANILAIALGLFALKLQWKLYWAVGVRWGKNAADWSDFPISASIYLWMAFAPGHGLWWSLAALLLALLWLRTNLDVEVQAKLAQKIEQLRNAKRI